MMTCRPLNSSTRNILSIFLQIIYILYVVRGSNLKITWTEPVEPVLQGPVQGSRIYLNRTVGPVQGSSKVPFELARPEQWHPYFGVSNVVQELYVIGQYVTFVSKSYPKHQRFGRRHTVQTSQSRPWVAR